MEIKVLGTVSPNCYLDKNGPGFLISEGKDKILLDAGDGITRLMNMKDDLNKLNIIISHFHKDHYAGLLPLSYATYINHNLGYITSRVNVYLPKTEKIKVAESYIDPDGWSSSRTVYKDLIDYIYIKNFNENYMNFIDYDSSSKFTFGSMNVEFLKTQHQIDTYAAKISCDNSTLAYLADTGYKESLLKFCQNVDLLICEATFLKGQTKNGNNHLYAYEAAEIAKKANVKQLMLTHFYPELDKQLYLNEAKEVFENTIVAEEGKILKLESGR